MVPLGKTLKPVDTIIIPSVSDNNKTLNWTTGGTDNHKFALNEVVLVLVSGKLFAEVFPLIAPMAVCELDFGGD